MSGIGLTYDLSGIDRIAARVEKIARIDRRGLLDVIGATVETQTRRRLEEEKTAPDGSKWPELSAAYAAKKKGTGGILEKDGHLIDSQEYHVLDDDSVEAGSNLKYSRIHQEGSGSEPVDVPAHVRRITRAFGKKLAFPVWVNVGAHQAVQNIPAREYLGISADNEDEIIANVDAYLDEVVNL